MIYDFVIVGGGIVGLSTAMALGARNRKAKILVIEKESNFAQHQTGRNSGVIHSGIYYTPGSMKARFARSGARSMVEFCEKHHIEHDICGKVIVATEQSQLPLLEKLYARGLENGLAIQKISSEQVNEIEPHVRCLAGIRVPATGIVSYRKVCAKYIELINAQGGEIKFGMRLDAIQDRGDHQVLETTGGDFNARYLINCAGLHSDRVARLAGVEPGARIVPFRGEYFELVPAKRHLVKTLIYPVPNPDFPFLGVHFTRMIDGTIHAGPNAVLAMKREGYHKTDFSLRDLSETLRYPGFWKLAAKHANEGAREFYRSFSKAAFVRSLQTLIPEVEAQDLAPTHAGVRAQALLANGKLVDDFLIVNGHNSMHVCNAPSPGATASLEIGKAIVERIPHLKSGQSPRQTSTLAI